MSLQQLKLPFKEVEIPLRRFNEVVIPYHSTLLMKHKENIRKYQKQEDWDHIRSEQNNVSRIIKQIKQSLYEMDVLRSQVEERDLEKFDKRIHESRQMMQQIFKSYIDLLKNIPNTPPKPITYCNDPESGLPESVVNHLQRFQDDIESDEIERKEACLRSAEKLQRELQDLNSSFLMLNQMVHDQGDMVNTVEQNVEVAQVNVVEGTRQLAQAARYKTVVYPVTGALMGGCIGGPIGLFAGIKLGGLAAIGCGISGYLGGKFLQQKSNETVLVDQMGAENPVVETNNDTNNKKLI